MTIACTNCGAANADSARACSVCSASLARTCQACAFANPPTHRFCGNCGVALAPAAITPDARHTMLIPNRSPATESRLLPTSRHTALPEGERRNVTILFTDVVGFTALSERLDPEQLYAIIEQLQQAFVAAIRKHEGWFDKFLGDGLMAIFGAPVAHEDDPARAVRAALDMDRALRSINEELDPRLGVTLRMRMGLNAGTVVVATMGTGMNFNYTPLGDAVNVASRLQEIAEPGSIVVSRAVYEQIKGQFDVTELGSIRIRGRVEPVEIYQVVALKRTPAQTRGLPGFHAPMVGRESEFDALARLAADWAQRRDRRLVLVAGEAGIGKSRLTTEFKAQLLPERVTLAGSASLAYGQAAYGLFTELLRALFRLAPDAPLTADQITAHVQALAGDSAAVAEIVPYVQHLLANGDGVSGADSGIRYLEPAQLRQQIFLAVRDLIVAEARRAPVVLVLEDLHWIDNLSAELLLFLIRSLVDVPVLFYCTSRVEAPSAALSRLDHAGRALPPGAFLRLDLGPLSADASESLLAHLLRQSRLVEPIKDLAHQRAEGNPLYLEEILRMLIEGGALRQTASGWEAAPDLNLSALEVPRTLQGLIMARVDSLPEESRTVLQCAAVIGRAFPKALLQRVLETDEPWYEADLRILSEHDLIAPLDRVGGTEYFFRHVLTQETVYASLLQRRRRRLHHQTAAAIESLYADRLDDFAEQLVYHYGEAHDPARALPYLIRSAERAVRRYANDEALRHYHAVVDMLPTLSTTPAQRVTVYQGLGDVQTVIGRYDDALQSFRNALEIARSASGVSARQIASLASRIGRVWMRKSNYEESLRWLETGLDELDRDPDSLRAVERMRVYHEMGWVYYQRGELEKAYQWRMRSLEIGAGTDYYAELGAAYNGLVPLFAARGDWDRARAYALEGLRMRERIGDSEGTARCYVNLANIALSQGEWNQAIEHYGRGLALALRVGQASTIFTIYHNLGELYTLKGDGATAREYLAQSLEVAESSGNVHQSCAALNNLAEVELMEGKGAQAEEILARSLARATETGNKLDLTQAHWLLAQARLDRGELTAAEESAEQAARVAGYANLGKYEGRAARAMGCIRRAQARFEESRELLERARGTFQRLKDRLEVSRTDVELAALDACEGYGETAARRARDAHAVFTALGAERERARAAALLPANVPA